MKTHTNIINELKYLALGVFIFVVVFMSWNQQPIYTDEAKDFRSVAFIFQNQWARYANFTVCNNYPSYDINILFYPAAYIFSIFGSVESYVQLRYSILSLFLVATIFYFIKIVKNNQNKQNRLIGIALLFAMFSGVLVSTVGIFRPEVFILLTLISAIMSVVQVKNSLISIASFTICILFYSMSLLMHPKSMLMLPILLMAAFVIYIKNRKSGVIFLLITVGISYFGYKMNAAQFIDCPNSPEFNLVLQSWSLNPIQLFASPLIFFKDLLAVIAYTDYNDIFWKMYYRQHYDFGMLPSLNSAPFAGLSNFLYTIVLSSAFILVFLKFKNAWFIIGKRGATSEERLEGLFFLILVLVIISFSIINRVGAWYDKGFWVASFLILAGYPKFIAKAKNINLIKIICLFSILCFTMSSIINIKYMRPILKTDYGTKGILLATSAIKDSNYREVMLKCGISGVEDGLVIDDEPIFLTSKSKNLTSFNYVIQPLGYEKGLAWIIANKTPAIIGRCDSLIEHIQSSRLKNKFDVHNFGGACCFKNNTLK
jgi:hypothetical protein